MSVAFSALCYLHAWEHHQPFEDGVAFEPLLRRIQPDYSVDSLARVDTLLDALRIAKKPQAEDFLQDGASRNLLYLLSFYVGEVIGRGLGCAPEWLSYEQSVAIDPANAAFGPGFENSVICRFPGSAEPRSYVAPLVAICSRLFVPEAGESVRRSAGLLVPTERQTPPASREPLPPVPLQLWPQAMREAAAQLLPGGQVVWAAALEVDAQLQRPHGKSRALGRVVVDPAGRTPPEVLAEVAQVLREAEPAKAEPARGAVADVPARVSPYPLKIAPVWFERSHLPGGRIAQPCFPVVANAGTVQFLPAAQWPAELLAAWA
jgi:hypothetical protein